MKSFLLIALLLLSLTGPIDAQQPVGEEEPTLIPIEMVEEETGIDRDHLVNRNTDTEVDFGIEAGLPKEILNDAGLTPVKSQGSRGTCMAFATVAALEGAFAGKIDLSEQHFYYTIKKDFFKFAEGILPEVIHWRIEHIDPVCIVGEQDWAYNPKPIKKNVPQGPPPQGIDQKKHFCIEETTYVGMGLVRNISLLKAVLAEGYNIVLMVLLPKGWNELWSVKGGNVDAGKLTLKSFIPAGAHGILIVGYDGNDRIIFRNSWGPSWGNKGYGTFSRKYLQMYGVSGFSILKTSERAQ